MGAKLLLHPLKTADGFQPLTADGGGRGDAGDTGKQGIEFLKHKS
jgi:hypothetical protein